MSSDVTTPLPSSPFRGDILRGRVVLITGGATGIGYGCAEAFGRHGARVAIMSRRRAVIELYASKPKVFGVFGGEERLICRGELKMAELLTRSQMEADVPIRAPESADAIAAVLGAMDARLHGDAGDILDSCKSVMRIFKISDPATVDRVQAADGDVQAAYAALEAATNAARGSLQKRLDEAAAAINAAVVSAHAAKHAVDVAPHDDF